MDANTRKKLARPAPRYLGTSMPSPNTRAAAGTTTVRSSVIERMQKRSATPNIFKTNYCLSLRGRGFSDAESPKQYY